MQRGKCFLHHKELFSLIFAPCTILKYMLLVKFELENFWWAEYFSQSDGIQMLRLALFDMPNSYRFDILSILIFSEISLSISIFSKISLSISIFSRKALSILISISIFLEWPYRYRYFSNFEYLISGKNDRILHPFCTIILSVFLWPPYRYR